MVRKTFLILTLVIVVLLSSCSSGSTAESPVPDINMPNPASVYCEQNGGKLELIQDPTGAVSGMCIFPDGSECDEWAYFRDECRPGTVSVLPATSAAPRETLPSSPAGSELDNNGWKIYRNTDLGYLFSYPVDAEIVINDEPLKSISIIGLLVDGEYWPQITISHPQDRTDYQPPDGANLREWLIDHSLIGDDPQLAALTIAGTDAIHIRHERSPQSYAFDRYYFAESGQLFEVTIGHVGDHEDWALYNLFLESFQFGD